MSVDQVMSSPLITNSGVNIQATAGRYYVNCADVAASITYRRELLTDTEVPRDHVMPIDFWGGMIIEEQHPC